MVEGMAQKIRVRSAMEHDGTVHVGRYRMMTSGDSVGGRIPKEHARALGLLDSKETDVYINYELGIAIQKIPDMNDESG